MRQPGCAECEQLWHDYAAATFKHVNHRRLKAHEATQAERVSSAEG